MTLQTQATEARKHFVLRKRDNGTQYWCAPDSEQWVTDLCLAAHNDGEILPDDWRYQAIVDALDMLEERKDWEEALDEWEPDIYTSDLTAWLASATWRVAYVDEGTTGFSGLASEFDRLQAGQLAEFREVFFAVQQFLFERRWAD
jgi:hypothetical protein